MANYSMTIREMMENELVGGVFTFNYPFYTDDEKDKKEFEKLFISYYYFNEIGFETPERFRKKLESKLNLIMPYYEQLYQTEWHRVDKDMMNQKDLIDRTTHTLTQTLSGEHQSNGNLTTNTTNQSNGKMSNLADGVSQTLLEEGYLTGASHSDDTGTGTSQNDMRATSNSHTILEETTVNESHGDIGIQTPAYAITEWRKVLININKMIIDDCYDLFMKIY